MNTHIKDSHQIDHKKSDSKEEKQEKKHLKREAAEALEENQWHKHPGGG